MSIAWGCIIAVISLAIGFSIGRMKESEPIEKFFRKLLLSLDNIVIAFAMVVVICTIFSDMLFPNNKIPSVVLNIFGSIVFSWLLTKKSAKLEFKEHEQELAKRSYRHLNHIEVATRTADQQLQEGIKNCKKNSSLSEEAGILLSKIQSSLFYIKSGIETCKYDWEDLMSESDLNLAKKKSDEIKNSMQYGDLLSKVNQEEA